MYLKKMSLKDPVERPILANLPISKNLKKALGNIKIDNPALIDILKDVVAIKKSSRYSNKQIVRIIEAINDNECKIFSINNTHKDAERIQQKITSDEKRFKEKPGNYIIISNNFEFSDRFEMFAGSESGKLGYAFVMIYNTDENHSRELLFFGTAKFTEQDYVYEDVDDFYWSSFLGKEDPVNYEEFIFEEEELFDPEEDLQEVMDTYEFLENLKELDKIDASPKI